MISFHPPSYVVGIISPILEFRVEETEVKRGHLPSHLWESRRAVKFTIKQGSQTTTASPVAQWWRIHLPVQETQIWCLILENPTWGATKPEHHNYWACALEPRNCSYWSPQALEPVLCNKRSHHNVSLHTTARAQPPLPATREGPRAAAKTQRSQNKR